MLLSSCVCIVCHETCLSDKMQKWLLISEAGLNNIYERGVAELWIKRCG